MADASGRLQQGRGPVGRGEYLVRPGDCISSIAKAHGLFWETVWNDPANAELKRARGDPNVLLPGDRVTVRALERRDESGATKQRHRFRRKGEPSKLRLRLLAEPEDERSAAAPSPPRYSGNDVDTEDPEPPDARREDQPRANVPYVVDVDGRRTEGQTDDDGRLEATIPGTARSARLILNPGTPDEEVFPIQLGHLDPIDEIAGVKQRLANLSFECGDRTNEVTPGLRQAIRGFQEKMGLEPTGELTDEVRQKLRDTHES